MAGKVTSRAPVDKPAEPDPSLDVVLEDTLLGPTTDDQSLVIPIADPPIEEGEKTVSWADMKKTDRFDEVVEMLAKECTVEELQKINESAGFDESAVANTLLAEKFTEGRRFVRIRPSSNRSMYVVGGTCFQPKRWYHVPDGFADRLMLEMDEGVSATTPLFEDTRNPTPESDGFVQEIVFVF